MDEFDFSDLRKRLENLMEMIEDDLAQVNVGRAKPALIEKVLVEAYESKLPLRELATISAPDPHQLVVQPWDVNIIEAVEKALKGGELGLNPVVDGELVRINIPVLSEERRQELGKLVRQRIEAGRVLLRQERQDVKNEIEALKNQPGVSEDDVKRFLKQLQEIIDEFMGQLEELGEEKEKELLTI